MTKKELRGVIKEKRSLLTKEYINYSDKAIQELVIKSRSFISAESIFVYVSSDKEPSTRLIIESALAQGKRVFVPKCISRGLMVAVEITENTVFEEGFMGIREPSVYDESFVLQRVDLSVIPCVSLTLSGKRLGHGAGFYDIFLENTITEKMCLCYHRLLCDDIPTDENDIAMDMSVTERGIFSCRQ